MRVVREVEINTAIALTQSFNLETIGAKGLIYQGSRDEGTLSELRGTPYATGQASPLVKWTPSGGGGSDEALCFGIPLPYETLDVIYTGAGVRNTRLVFVDEPIAQFGKVPLFNLTGSVAALGTVAILANRNIGIIKEVQFIMSGNRAYHANITPTYQGTSFTWNSFMVLVAAAGGFVVSSKVPAPRIISVDIVNDDAALLLSHVFGIYGFLA